MQNSIEVVDNSLQVIDCGPRFIKETCQRNVTFDSNIKVAKTHCGCISAMFKSNSKVLTVVWKMSKEFPFQVNLEHLDKIQVVDITLEDDTEFKLKFTASLLNPEKW